MKRVLWAMGMIALLMTAVTAEADTNSQYSLSKYHVDIKVNENNTFQITEYIRAHFFVDRHGIIRKIPLRNEVVRLNGTKSRNKVKITDVSVEGDMFEESVSGGNKIFRIGDPYQMITGSKDYVISYLYDIGKDPGKDYDELYFNIIGNEWDTSIESVTFTVTMPKDFDASTLGFSSGDFGATDNDNIISEVRGQVISGSYNGKLKAGEALTVRLELPEGYFVGATENNPDAMMLLSFVLPFIFLLIVLAMWYVYGRDERVVSPVELYPPKGYNSAETGFLYRGKADTQDVVSLLIYLANKGYIKITETQDKSLFSTVNRYIITKLKEYDGNNQNERLFLKGLFKLSKSRGDESVKEVTIEDLEDKFYVTLNAIIADMNKKQNRESIFEKNSLNKQWPVVLMTLATFLLITVRPMLEYYAYEPEVLFVLIFPIIGFLILFLTLFTNAITVNGKPTTKRFTVIFFGLGFGLVFGGFPLAGLVLPALIVETFYWMAFLTGMVCIVLMLLLNKYMKKRTRLGNELLGQIKGFKRFLETSEKHRLEQLVCQTPDYFYDILPFAYVLGVSNVWIKKFENIAIMQPDWYSGSDGFSHASFGHFMDTTMKSALSAMASSPSSSDSSSNSGSSGGGSSGGGSGGGGGSSW